MKLSYNQGTWLIVWITIFVVICVFSAAYFGYNQPRAIFAQEWCKARNLEPTQWINSSRWVCRNDSGQIFLPPEPK